MKILRYKKGTKGKYRVYLEDERELNLYEEVILKYELLIRKEIKNSDFDNINKYNLECDVYYVALNSLKSRFKSINDMRNFLVKKEYPNDLIDKAIEKLINQGYLNDELYCKSYINTQILTTSKGPNKIKRELIDSGVSSEIIDRNIDIFDRQSQIDKINKITTKLLKSNRSSGGSLLRKKISTYLCNLGYENSLVYEVLRDYNFSDNKDIAKREYQKLYSKYSKKYSGEELERIIKNKMYLKGFQDFDCE